MTQCKYALQRGFFKGAIGFADVLTARAALSGARARPCKLTRPVTPLGHESAAENAAAVDRRSLRPQFPNPKLTASLRDGRAASRPTCYAPGQRLAGAAPQTPLVGALRLRCEVGAARLQGVIAVNMFVIFVLELNSRRFAPPL